jgi:hypothetical protein
MKQISVMGLFPRLSIGALRAAESFGFGEIVRLRPLRLFDSRACALSSRHRADAFDGDGLRVAMRSTDTIALARKVAFTTASQWSHAVIFMPRQSGERWKCLKPK